MDWDWETSHDIITKLLHEQDCTQEILAIKMGRQPQYVSHRMTGKKGWTISECYWLLEFFGWPHDRFFEMFPPRKGAPKAKPKAIAPQTLLIRLELPDGIQCNVAAVEVAS